MHYLCLGPAALHLSCLPCLAVSDTPAFYACSLLHQLLFIKLCASTMEPGLPREGCIPRRVDLGCCVVLLPLCLPAYAVHAYTWHSQLHASDIRCAAALSPHVAQCSIVLLHHDACSGVRVYSGHTQSYACGSKHSSPYLICLMSALLCMVWLRWWW
jgi:hypothetical protein